jgi:hypothetical protein
MRLILRLMRLSPPELQSLWNGGGGISRFRTRCLWETKIHFPGFVTSSHQRLGSWAPETAFGGLRNLTTRHNRPFPPVRS